MARSSYIKRLVRKRLDGIEERLAEKNHQREIRKMSYRLHRMRRLGKLEALDEGRRYLEKSELLTVEEERLGTTVFGTQCGVSLVYCNKRLIGYLRE